MATIEDLKKIVFEFDMDNAEAVANDVIAAGKTRLRLLITRHAGRVPRTLVRG
jgi:hypothetical protein